MLGATASAYSGMQGAGSPVGGGAGMWVGMGTSEFESIVIELSTPSKSGVLSSFGDGCTLNRRKTWSLTFIKK